MFRSTFGRRTVCIAIGLALTGLMPGIAGAQEQVNLGVSVPSADHGFTAGIVWWANEAKKDLEAEYPTIKVTVRTAANASEQANQLQDLSTISKINALVVFPYESAALTKPVEQVKKRGAFITVVDRGLSDESIQDSYMAGDNVAFGRIPGEYMAEKYDGKANILVLRGIASTADTERWDAFNAAIAPYPDMKILDAQFGNWNRDDAFKVTQDYLTRFKEVDVIWAADDDMAIGVLKAIEEAGRTDIKEVFGGAGAKGMVKMLMDGENPLIQADVSYSPKFIYDAIKMTAEARLKGEDLPDRYIIPSVLITKENAEDFYFPDSPF